jgi:hypothetical protein
MRHPLEPIVSRQLIQYTPLFPFITSAPCCLLLTVPTATDAIAVRIRMPMRSTGGLLTVPLATDAFAFV